MRKEDLIEPKTIKEPESVIREIKRKTRRKFNSEDIGRIILKDLKSVDSIAVICRRESVDPNLSSGAKLFYELANSS